MAAPIPIPMKPFSADTRQHRRLLDGPCIWHEDIGVPYILLYTLLYVLLYILLYIPMCGAVLRLTTDRGV